MARQRQDEWSATRNSIYEMTLKVTRAVAVATGVYRYVHRVLKNVPPLACYNWRTWMDFDIFWQKCYR